MISGTYIIAGLLLIGTAILFKNGSLNATTQTICWAVVFFFASAGASAGYLTASEVFPLEVRAQSIAVFFAIAMILGGLAAIFFGVNAEGKALEDVATPLSVMAAKQKTIPPQRGAAPAS